MGHRVTLLNWTVSINPLAQSTMHHFSPDTFQFSSACIAFLNLGFLDLLLMMCLGVHSALPMEVTLKWETTYLVPRQCSADLL